MKKLISMSKYLYDIRAYSKILKSLTSTVNACSSLSKI